jgi:hypothetical protein
MAREFLDAEVSLIKTSRTAPEEMLVSGRANPLFEAVHNPAACQIVWGNFYPDPITQKNANVILAHLSGEVCEDLVAVIQFNLKLGAG